METPLCENLPRLKNKDKLELQMILPKSMVYQPTFTPMMRLTSSRPKMTDINSFPAMRFSMKNVSQQVDRLSLTKQRSDNKSSPRQPNPKKLNQNIKKNQEAFRQYLVDTFTGHSTSYSMTPTATTKQQKAFKLKNFAQLLDMQPCKKFNQAMLKCENYEAYSAKTKRQKQKNIEEPKEFIRSPIPLTAEKPVSPNETQRLSFLQNKNLNRLRQSSTINFVPEKLAQEQEERQKLQQRQSAASQFSRLLKESHRKKFLRSNESTYSEVTDDLSDSDLDEKKYSKQSPKEQFLAKKKKLKFKELMQFDINMIDQNNQKILNAQRPRCNYSQPSAPSKGRRVRFYLDEMQ